LSEPAAETCTLPANREDSFNTTMAPRTVFEDLDRPKPPLFTNAERETFARNGYIIVRGLADQALCHEMRTVANEHLARRIEPLELETDLHYPGAPVSAESEGGKTIRRLLQAQGRHPVFTRWLTSPSLSGRLHQLLGPKVIMPLAHHNCVMTKQPHYSSETGWHQDIRYWSFERPELITVWLALGNETPENGGLKLIPGTHRLCFNASRLDEASFLRDDLAENQALIDSHIDVMLHAGDVLFFHCRTLHAAGRNRTEEVKLSVVFTFRPADNLPLPGTRSTSLPELLIAAD
jgi:phytanoyl-CoA hydroxylase